ncbi:glycosyltransferase [Candidatus Falkowbacteria bacterium]|uniref:Glycosyl transferase family 1 domain-containing protein n=1 Tax=Candidatus Buchananbacteria bacterium CG10_big_fil_rev_8_21_14_0_10_33_19 TaxID=1974525 RepID=A0A2H0W378_9BACT|nr:glycosyltransferase [Candidatus Falkowbacteria bacterium]PIS05822.1 MAG: hypothetical protein COT80_03590 [Candidatus Buchananbacteria bacterium CG10_big_fil_rev_8_21_14_0_10_33_19]
MIKGLVKKHKVIIIIFLLSLFLRLLTFGLLIDNYGTGSFYLANNTEVLDGNDTQHYVIIASNISEHGVYSRFINEPFEPDSLRTPLLPLYFLPFIHFLGFSSVWLAMLLLVIILSAIPVEAYYLAKLFLSNKLSLVAGLLVALQPLMIYFTSITEPDMLMIFLFLLVIYHFCLYYINNTSKNLLLSALLLGLMTLAKPVGIYIAVILVIFVALKIIKNKKVFLNLFLFIFIFGLIISPWLYRNYQVFGTVDISAIKSTNLYLYYTVGFEKNNEVLPVDLGERQPVKNIKYQKEYVSLAVDRILNQPIAYTMHHLIGTLRSMLAGDLQEIYHKGHSNILPFSLDLEGRVNITDSLQSGKLLVVIKSILLNFNLLLRYLILTILYILVAFGWLMSYKSNKKTFVLFTMFGVLIAYFFLSSGPFVSPKYRLPIMPLLLIMSLYTFSNMKKNKINDKKIVIASGTYLPEISGQSTFVDNFKKNLPADYELVIVAYGNKTEVVNNNIYYIKRNIFRHLNYYLTIRNQAKDAVIIYAQDLVSSGLPAALAKRSSNYLVVRIGGDFLWEKMVNTGKTEVPISQYYQQPKSLLEKLYLKLYHYVINKSDKLIFNTPWPQKWYADYFNISINKISVIQNPFTINNKIDVNDSVIGDEIIYAGRFIPLKNLERLIEAFKKIKTDKKLVIIGAGPQYNDLQKLAASDQRIAIVDKMNQAQLWQRIAKSYLFILPSISEFNPNVAIEALSLHKPVILTKEVGLSDDLKSKFVLADPLSVDSIEKQIEYLLNGENYKNFLDNLSIGDLSYDWSKVMSEHIEVFNSIINQINVLNIGTDRGLAGGKKLGDAIARHRAYGEHVDNLDIITYSSSRDNLLGLKISDNVTGYATNSLFKIFFVFDVIKIFRKINKQHKINIVVCQDPFVPALAGLFLKIFYHVKLQINFHGDFWQNKNWLKENPINFIFLLISKFTVPFADAIRVMSDGQKLKLGSYAKKARVISTPVDIKKILDSSQTVSSEGALMVLHVGRDDKVKDYDTLLKSWNIINTDLNTDKKKRVMFYQSGADQELDKAKAALGQAGLDINIIKLGRKDHDSLIKYYNQANVVMLSSTSESFGKVLIEASAAGKPVVSTSTTGAKEIIVDQKNGYLVPIGDANGLAEKIIYLLENSDKAKAMGETGREMVVKKYGHNTEKIIKLWQDIIKNNI